MKNTNTTNFKQIAQDVFDKINNIPTTPCLKRYTNVYEMIFATMYYHAGVQLIHKPSAASMNEPYNSKFYDFECLTEETIMDVVFDGELAKLYHKDRRVTQEEVMKNEETRLFGIAFIELTEDLMQFYEYAKELLLQITTDANCLEYNAIVEIINKQQFKMNS